MGHYISQRQGQHQVRLPLVSAVNEKSTDAPVTPAAVPEEGVESPREDRLPPLQRGAPRRREGFPHGPAPLQLLQGGPLQGGEHGGGGAPHSQLSQFPFLSLSFKHLYCHSHLSPLGEEANLH